MKKLLITGFEPFGGEKINPSWDAVCRLPDSIGEYQLFKRLLPVTFTGAARCALEAAAEIGPHAILCIGQAGGREAITPELVAINLRHAKIPDNDGYQPQDEPIREGGDCAYFSTLPMRSIAEAMSAEGFPARLSYSAGAYVCNDLLYTLLSHFEGSKTKVGFLHVPYSTEQKKEPSMPLDRIVQALTVAVERLEE